MGRRGRMKYKALTPTYNGAPTDWTKIKKLSEQERKAVDHKSLEYNNGGGKTLADYVDSKFDPENYLGKGR